MIDYITSLIGKYKYTVMPYSCGLFTKAQQIWIEETATNQTFKQLFNLLTDNLGIPDYVHSEYSFLWVKNKTIIAYTEMDMYRTNTINIFIFNRMPRGKKITYTEYCQLNDIINEFASKHSLSYDDTIIYYDNTFFYELYNDTRELMLLIKNDTVSYNLFPIERDGSTVITHLAAEYHGEKYINRKNMTSVYSVLQEIFDEINFKE